MSDESFNKNCILVVDDNAINLEILSVYLEKSGYCVITAENGETALNQARNLSPDLILLDVIMPDIDGFEVCRRLKADAETANIPVIMMTALTDEADKVSGFEVGAVDYVTKPLHYKEVLARLNTHLTISNLQKQLQQANNELEERVASRTKRLNLIAKISRYLNTTLELDDLLQGFVDELKTSLGYYLVTIFLLDDAQENFVLVAGTQPFGNQLKEEGYRISLSAANSLISQAARTGDVVLVKDVAVNDQWLSHPLVPDTQSEIVVPIYKENKINGVLDVQMDTVCGLNDQDKTLLHSLANQLAVAIYNANLYGLARQANEDLSKSNRDKDKFFSIVAHDLKGPFMPLLGSAEVLSEVADMLSTEDIKRMSQSMHRSALRVFRLLENLLEWSRVQMGRMDYQPEYLSLRQVSQTTVNLLGSNAEEKSITLNNHVPDDLVVFADAYMLDTIIRNLTNNALKFTPRGGHVTITGHSNLSQMMPDKPHPDFVELRVTDTGVGISSENLDKLFKIEVHHSSTGTENESGTGLGLVLCKELVELNNGQLWIKSKLGRGTTVGVTLPKGSAVDISLDNNCDTSKCKLALREELTQPSVTPADSAPVNKRHVSYAEVMKMSESVNRSAKAIYDLLDDLSGWVKTQMSWIPYQPTEFEAKARIDKNLRHLVEKAAQQHIHVNRDFVDPLLVKADENIFDALIQGLFLNALKFTPKQGCITVSMRHQATESSNYSECVVSISDTGNGIEKKQFVMLLRDGNLGNVSNGTSQTNIGLGLSIYRQLVRKNGGQMWSESELGKGTTISFTVPVANLSPPHSTLKN